MLRHAPCTPCFKHGNSSPRHPTPRIFHTVHPTPPCPHVQQPSCSPVARLAAVDTTPHHTVNRALALATALATCPCHCQPRTCTCKASTAGLHLQRPSPCTATHYTPHTTHFTHHPPCPLQGKQCRPASTTAWRPAISSQQRSSPHTITSRHTLHTPPSLTSAGQAVQAFTLSCLAAGNQFTMTVKPTHQHLTPHPSHPTLPDIRRASRSGLHPQRP